jgi:uncharacterized membrane protein YhaH (DUF805 family)
MRRLLLSFRGRLQRSRFWLATVLVWAAFIVLFIALEQLAGRASTLALYPPFLWALLALAVKRYHDLERSGWWLLVLVIPIVGVLWVAIQLGLRRGTLGDNRYGRDPLASDLDYYVVR